MKLGPYRSAGDVVTRTWKSIYGCGSCAIVAIRFCWIGRQIRPLREKRGCSILQIIFVVANVWETAKLSLYLCSMKIVCQETQSCTVIGKHALAYKFKIVLFLPKKNVILLLKWKEKLRKKIVCIGFVKLSVQTWTCITVSTDQEYLFYFASWRRGAKETMRYNPTFFWFQSSPVRN